MLAGQNASTPWLSYSTYLGGGFAPTAMAADTAGNVYLAGAEKLDPLSFATSVLVIKLNRQASEYVNVTQVSGLASASPRAIALGGSGNVWITGVNSIPDATPPVQQSFLAKLDPSGAVMFSKIYGAPRRDNQRHNARRLTAGGSAAVVLFGIAGG